MKIENIRTNTEGLKKLVDYLNSDKNVFVSDDQAVRRGFFI